MDGTITEIEPGDIDIDLKVICKLMGIDPENIPEPHGGIIRNELGEAAGYRNIKGGYIISKNIDIVSPKGIFLFEGTEFGPGKQVVNNLRNSEMLGLFVCTAGGEVSIRSRELMKSGNMLEGYVADLIGSLLVEGAMDIIHSRLGEHAKKKGLKVTNRYSPGYCNWNIAEQKKLFGLFPDGFCGVSLSESCLMMPVKSVSGVIGIGRKVIYNKYICDVCRDVYCIYRDKR